MSTTTSKRVPKLTEKAKAAVEERHALLNKPPDSNADTPNERETPEVASTKLPTKCKNTNSGDVVGKKARATTNVDEDVPIREESTRNSSPAAEPAESPEDELGTFKDL